MNLLIIQNTKKIFVICLFAMLCSCILIEKEKPIDYNDEEARVMLPEEIEEQPAPPPIRAPIAPIIADNKVEEPNRTLITPYSEPEKEIITQEVSPIPFTQESGRKVEIAMLIPTSGKNKELGTSIMNAASISLFENDRERIVKLIIFDVSDDNNSIDNAFRKIIAQKIKFVIGPVFSNSISRIDKLARDNEIIVMSLSNNSEMLGKTNEFGGVFLGGIYPQAQVDKITNFAIEQNKLNFAIIAPNNQYGQTLTQYLKAFVRSRNANFITSEFYDLNGRNIDRAVERAINSFLIPENIKNNRSERPINEYDRTYPDVILIPESGKMLSKILASMKRQNVSERKIQIIGTSQWDEISTLNDPNLIGAWFAAPESRDFYNFEKRYYNIFKKIPPRISSISYDFVNSIIAVTRKNRLKQENVTSLKDFLDYSDSGRIGFAGIDGYFRFLSNGAVQRNLAVLKVGNGNVEVIEKPAETFLKY